MGTRLGTVQKVNRRAAGAAFPGLPRFHWDLMPGVRWSSPETRRDGKIESRKGRNGKTCNKRRKGEQTVDNS